MALEKCRPGASRPQRAAPLSEGAPQSDGAGLLASSPGPVHALRLLTTQGQRSPGIRGAFGDPGAPVGSAAPSHPQPRGGESTT